MCADMYRGGLQRQYPAGAGLGLRPRHKVFVSYHHANDQLYRESFERMFTAEHHVMVSASVQVGDISPTLSSDRIRQIIRDEYLQDSTVTVVLIGTQTWQRKHIDWEIGSSIRDTQNNPRSGLLGILLPSYQMIDDRTYDSNTIPPRLHDNILCGYAAIYKWSNDPIAVSAWIHDAFERRNAINPDNSFPSYANNRTGLRWQP